MNQTLMGIWTRITWKPIILTLVWAAFSVSAFAADNVHPAEPPPMQSSPIWNRTGIYIGGHIGGLRFQSRDWTVRTPGGAFYGQSIGSHDANGWIGGIHVGYHYQLAKGFLIGLQGDYAWGDASGNHDSERETGVAYHSKVKSLATITGRLGYAVNRLLGYIRGGVAWERNDFWATTTILGTAYTADATLLGWTLGAGAEYAFTQRLFGFIEYDYYNFGTRNIAFTPQVSGLPTGYLDITQTTSAVRIGVSYRFGGSAASVTAP
jgi:outer membrane immunogenic protein